jgi:hypothetical protein
VKAELRIQGSIGAILSTAGHPLSPWKQIAQYRSTLRVDSPAIQKFNHLVSDFNCANNDLTAAVNARFTKFNDAQTSIAILWIQSKRYFGDKNESNKVSSSILRSGCLY